MAQHSMPQVAIVGGSLGGLTAALVLRDLGCAVTIYERSPSALVGLGAGIVLHPITVRYLYQRAAIDLAAVSVTARAVRYLGRDGMILHERPCDYRFSSYNALYHGLRSNLPAAHYRLGSNVLGFRQDASGVTLELADGRSERADLLIGADGIRSTIRRQLLPQIAPVYAGYVAWRGTVAADALGPRERSALDSAIIYHIMPQSHLLTYPIPVVAADGSESTHINWLWYRNVAAGGQLADLLTDSGGTQREVSVPAGAVAERHLQELAAAAEQLPALLQALLGETAQPFLQTIVDLAVPRMAFGRVALIGDAAFVARPHAAAGTAKAADDAWALAEALAAAAGDIEQALAQWEPERLAVGRGVLERTRAAGRRLQLESSWPVGEPLPFGLRYTGDSAEWP